MSFKIKYLFLFIPFIFFAQENTFYHYGLDDGLSQETVQTILKDATGFIWLGTQEGLNRFDGSTFKVYKNDFENENSLCGNDVEKLLEFKNYLFIGSKNNGICYYNKAQNIFYKTSITKGYCTGLVQYKNTIYASIFNDGIYKIEFINNNFISTKLTNIQIPKNITSLYFINNKLFIGTSSGTISILNLINNTITSHQITKKSEIIKTFYFDTNFLCIGTSAGLFKMNTSNNVITAINLEKLKLKTTEKISINKIYSKANNFYIASDNGLYILTNFNVNSNHFQDFSIFIGDKNNANSITSNRVYDLLLTKDFLWIGTNKLDILNLKKTIFKSINTKSKPSINNNHIYATLKTKNYLFVGTRNGLNCIDNNGNTTIITKENTNNKLAFNVIRDITKDPNNNLWIGTTKGISILNLTNFNPKKPKIKSFYHNVKDTISLSNNNIRNIFIDRQNNIWVATFGGGINLFTGNLKLNTIRFKRFTAKNKNSISSNFTFSMIQTKDDSYWINTENGLNKLRFKNHNYQNPIFKVFNKDLSNKTALKSNSIITASLDKKDANILWIGSENGLYKFDISQEIFNYYGAKNGLTNTVVYSVLEDLNNYLWIASNSGLFQFNKTSEKFINYTVNDGLNNIEFNLGSQFYDEQNQHLYFGGTNGLSYFNPKDIKNLYHEGHLIFTQLNIKDKEIYPLDDAKIITESIVNSEIINLKYNDFPAKLQFANLEYNFSNSSDFVYKLLPNDSDWNAITNQKEIQFLNLKSGTYQLLIQGKGKEKLWSKAPLKIEIKVSPPWYRSNFAYLLYALFVIGLIWLFFKFQINKNLKQQEIIRLKEINTLKTKLYANITHEFRTPITVILGMAENIKEKLTKSKINADEPIEMIERNSKNLLNLVNQILDLSKLEKGKLKLNYENGNIITHLKYLTESFHSYAEEKQITLVFYNEEEEILMDYDTNKITQILTNLIANAIKFCNENGKIVVHVKKKIKNNIPTLIVKVKDTGIGITAKDLPFIFDRFYQAENNLSNKYDGTGIGLALTKELINLLQGTIEVKSEPNKGTTFIFLLPITLKAKTVQKNNQPIKKITTQNNVDNIIIDDNLPICLIVEDNKDVATYIKICLEDKYQILYANDGQKGIEMALKQIPDIIISDIMMPNKNGFELCKTLKNDIKTNHIPIVLLTAKTSQDDKITGLKLGADAYLTKPFNKEELLIRVKKLIDIRKTLQNKYKEVSSWVAAKKPIIDKENKNDLFIIKVIKLINNHIDDTSFNAKKLSKLIYLSESQLHRKLKALTNTSTSLFIRKVKLQKAKQLIDENNLNISEICYATGFNNPSWFSKIFKDEFGFTPSNKNK